MKAKVFTRIPLKQAWLDEVVALIPNLTFEVINTDKQLTFTYNPYKKSAYGDFKSLRAIINDNTVQMRVFCMPFSELKAAGVTNHLALYDNTDRDGIFDFYIGLKPSLDPRAKANGFKSNFAWEMIHEPLHGYEQNQGREYEKPNGDRTHEWEANGQLKALLAENLANGIELQKQQINLLQSIVAALKAALAAKKPTVTAPPKDLLPLVKRQADKLVKEMEMMGLPIRITEGYRSPERQNELYAQGRIKPGQIVTKAKGGESLHNYGVAFDIVFRKLGYDASNDQWLAMATIAEGLGFEWGGKWNEFVDKPHLQMLKGYKLKDFQNNLVDYSKYN